MNLKTFNVSNLPNSREQKPFIQINSKTGLFNINAAAAALMELKDGDQVQFHQSEEEPADWFFEKVKRDGFVIRYKENIGKGFLFNSSKLARLIFESVKYTGTGGRVYVGELIKHGKSNLYTLITGALKINSHA